MSSQAEPSTETVERASFIVASKYRQEVCKVLKGTAGTPSSIAKETDARISHVSRALREMVDEDIVRLMVDEERRKGRIYELTDTGAKATTFAEGL